MYGGLLHIEVINFTVDCGDTSPQHHNHNQLYFFLSLASNTWQFSVGSTTKDKYEKYRVATLNLVMESIPSEKYFFNPESTYIEQITVHLILFSTFLQQN